jgi:hypothetical protein
VQQALPPQEKYAESIVAHRYRLYKVVQKDGNVRYVETWDLPSDPLDIPLNALPDGPLQIAFEDDSSDRSSIQHAVNGYCRIHNITIAES